MDEKRTAIMPETGSLPEQGMLGIAYVPMQKYNSPRYNPREGIKNGTLFPGLNLPYRHYIASKDVADTPLGQIMTMSFAINELGLYLDTHPNDKEALQLHNGYVKMLRDATERYEREISPLTQNVHMEDKYSWIQDPWPWEER